MSRKVIDVSSHQGRVDWKKVKDSGVEGAILKIIRKDLKPDMRFEENWAGCVQANMPIIGVYNYIYAITERESRKAAEKVVETLNGRKAKVWYDMEDEVLLQISGTQRMRNVEVYRKVIEDAGLSFGIYTGLSFYNSHIKPYGKELDCNFWIARYPYQSSMKITDKVPASKKPSIRQKLAGWQYSNKVRVSGITGDADMSLWYEEIVSISAVKPLLYGGLDYSSVFDAEYYSNRYQDLKEAYGDNAEALFMHFLTHGMKEGRQASAAFNVHAYQDRYADLRKAFGENLPLYYQHYIQFGKDEKRNPL